MNWVDWAVWQGGEGTEMVHYENFLYHFCSSTSPLQRSPLTPLRLIIIPIPIYIRFNQPGHELGRLSRLARRWRHRNGTLWEFPISLLQLHQSIAALPIEATAINYHSHTHLHQVQSTPPWTGPTEPSGNAVKAQKWYIMRISYITFAAPPVYCSAPHWSYCD